MGSTQETRMSSAVKPTQEKMSAAQENQVSSMILSKTSQALKQNSISKVIWPDLENKK